MVGQASKQVIFNEDCAIKDIVYLLQYSKRSEK